jgi:Mor family transcriptional regulator
MTRSIDVEAVIKDYIDDGSMDIKKLAAKYDCSVSVIYRIFKYARETQHRDIPVRWKPPVYHPPYSRRPKL